MPVVYLKNPAGGLHATILKEAKIHTANHNQFIIVKNSDKNETEIKVNLNMTPNAIGWSLASDLGLYIKLV